MNSRKSTNLKALEESKAFQIDNYQENPSPIAKLAEQKTEKVSVIELLDGKSPVWLYFKKIEDSKERKTYTICSVDGCEEKLAYHNSTTAMLRHLKSLHPTTCMSACQKSSKQTTLTSSDFKGHPLSKERRKNITMAIGRFLAFDMHAIKTIEGTGFKTLLRILEPRYILPCRKLSMKT